GVGHDWNVEGGCFLNDRAVQLRRERLERATPVVNPDLDELRPGLHVISNRTPTLVDGRHRGHDISPRWVPAGAGSWPRNAGTRSPEQRRIRNHFVAYLKRHVAPGETTRFRHQRIPGSLEHVEMVGRHDFSLGETGDASQRTERH